MEAINIILAGIISLLGFPIGLLIAHLTKEELKPGRKYFVWLSDLMLITASIILIFAIGINIYMSIGLALILTITITMYHPKPLIGYPLVIIAFILATKNLTLLATTASIIFIYGLPTAAIKNVKR